MLSPRTLSLRIKNKCLLMSLEKCINTAQGKEPDCEKIDGNYLRDCDFEEWSFMEKAKSFISSNQHTDDHKSELNFGSERSMSSKSNSIFGEQTQNQKVPAGIIGTTVISTKECLPYKNSSFNSTDDLRQIVREVLAEVNTKEKFRNPMANRKKDCPKRNFSEANSTGSRSFKSISQEQQRAAEAQMHASTHSHSLSKCYCISHSAKPQPDSTYAVQLYGRKQRIPPRLKNQRYCAGSFPRQSRFVRWADKTNHFKDDDEISSFPQQQAFEQTETSSRMRGHLCESPHNFSLDHSPHFSHHPQKTLFDRVKMFRESHWSDCHALPKGAATPSGHECVQRYVLNKRLFLEPVHADIKGDSCCPVCLPQSTSTNLCKHTSHKEMKLPSYENHASHIMVTLPKIIQEPDHRHSELETDEKKGVKTKSCLHVGHHSLGDSVKSRSFPKDSLALRYQK